jgi:hypothetical protein
MKRDMNEFGQRLAAGWRRFVCFALLASGGMCRGEQLARATLLEYVPGMIVPFEVRGWGLTGESAVAGYRLGQIVNSPAIVAGSVQWSGGGISLAVTNMVFTGTAEPGEDGGTPNTNVIYTVSGFNVAPQVNFGTLTILASDNAAFRQFSQSTRVVGVACGEFHTLLLRRDGTVGATGWNAVGQTSVPPAVSNAVAVACGLDHSIAVRRDGTVAVWGKPLVRGTPLADSLAPSDEENHDIVAAAGGALHSVFLRRDGRVLVAGWGARSVMAPPPSLTNAISISAGAYHNIALTRDGKMVEWGIPLESPEHGEDEHDWPRIRCAGDVIAVAAGGEYSMALHADRTVTAWGEGEYGETLVPKSATNVVAIAAGTYHALALKDDGTVVAWGATEGGMTDVPSGLTNVVAIAAGGYHNQALVQTQPVLTWPRLLDGRLLAEVNLPAGMRYRLETSTGDGLWHAVSTNVAWPGSMSLDVPAGDRSVLLMRAEAIH